MCLSLNDKNIENNNNNNMLFGLKHIKGSNIAVSRQQMLLLNGFFSVPIVYDKKSNLPAI